MRSKCDTSAFQHRRFGTAAPGSSSVFLREQLPGTQTYFCPRLSIRISLSPVRPLSHQRLMYYRFIKRDIEYIVA
jgi:hypothetical protein